MDQQKKSTFVNALAWIFIALTGFAILISILQNIMISVMFPAEEMSRAFEDPQAQEQIPAFFTFIFSNIRLFFLSFLIVSGTAFVSAIGLLKRKNWARIIFIAIMVLGICWNLFALFIQNHMFSSIPGFPPGEIDAKFSTMMNVMKIVSFIFAVGISYLFGWIIYKLSSLKIRTEFLRSLPVKTNRDTGELGSPHNKKGKIIVAGSVALTIAVGVFYFGSSDIKTDVKVTNIQQLAISGDAIKLSELLREQPYLANTIRQNDNWTPLHGAACNGNTDCVKLLIEAGADVDVQSCNQSTALHCGAEDGNAEIVELLLKANANPNLKDFKGKTPLDWAIWKDNKDIIDLLRKHNAKTSLELKGVKL